MDTTEHADAARWVGSTVLNLNESSVRDLLAPLARSEDALRGLKLRVGDNGLARSPAQQLLLRRQRAIVAELRLSLIHI